MCAFSALSIGLNKLPLLLGATLLPVADVFSSDLETSFSCPNESEPADEGDPSVIPGQSDSREEGWGLLSLTWHALSGVQPLVVMVPKIENCYRSRISRHFGVKKLFENSPLVFLSSGSHLPVPAR